MEDNKIEMTEDIEYWLTKAKNSIEQSLQDKDPMICLSSIRQAEIAIRSHKIYIQSKSDTEDVPNNATIEQQTN